MVKVLYHPTFVWSDHIVTGLVYNPLVFIIILTKKIIARKIKVLLVLKVSFSFQLPKLFIFIPDLNCLLKLIKIFKN